MLSAQTELDAELEPMKQEIMTFAEMRNRESVA